MTVRAYSNFDFCPDDFADDAKDIAVANDALPKKITDAKSGAVSYFIITKCTIGFREASRLVQIANETSSVIRIVAGRSTGNASSILSVIKMGIKENTPIAVSIMHGDTTAAFNKCLAVFNGN